MERSKPTPSLDVPTLDPFSETPPLFRLNGVPPLEEGPDPFDPESLRLPQDFSAALGVRKVLTVQVRKPAKEWFMRVHPDPAYHLQTALIELKEARESYLVSQHLWWRPRGREHPHPANVVSRGQSPARRVLLADPTPWNGWSHRYLVEIRPRSSTDGREHVGASHAESSLAGTNVHYAEHAIDPVWPGQSMSALLRTAFKDRYIDTLEHPILRQLRGEV